MCVQVWFTAFLVLVATHGVILSVCRRSVQPSLSWWRLMESFCLCAGVVYSLKNMRKDEATLSFVNLTLDTAEGPSFTQRSREHAPS